MSSKILILCCLLSSTYSTEVSSGQESIPNKGSSSRIPLVKHGAPRDLLSLLEIHSNFNLGIVGGLPTNITEHPYQITLENSQTVYPSGFCQRNSFWKNKITNNDLLVIFYHLKLQFTKPDKDKATGIIHLQVAIDNGKSFVCAGALLNRIWAVTLASCAAGAVATDLTVRVGSDSNLHGGTVLNVTQIVVHPNFNYSSLDYDFALLKFNTYICFDQYSKAIQFAEKKPQSRVQATVSGWGSTKGLSSSKTNPFRQVTMRTTTLGVCQHKYKKSGDTITDRMFCAMAGNKGPCHDDFGDPLIMNGTLYGLYSWSRGCPSKEFPAVFSNLAYVSDWIYTTMNNACTCGLY